MVWSVGTLESSGVIAELTDETNVAHGFSLRPMARAFGYIIGCACSLLWSPYCRVFGLLWAVCYHNRKIDGLTTFPILSGKNTHTFFHACTHRLRITISHIECDVCKRGTLSVILRVQLGSHVAKTFDCNPSAKQQASNPSKTASFFFFFKSI